MVTIEVTEAEYAVIRRLLQKEVSHYKMDAQSGDKPLENLSAVILPSRQVLLDKFPVRPAMLPRIAAHFSVEE